MREIRTEITIKATKEKIWEILTDFEHYPDWNPFILSIKGHLKKKHLLEIEAKSPNGGTMRFKPRVTSYKFEEEFSWLGSLLMFGIFDGRHLFKIIEINNGECQLLHQEKFSGILVPFFWKKLNTATRQGFNNMNEALKSRAENESN